MHTVTVIGRGLNKTKICRFCLRSKVPLIDLFSSKMKSNMIWKCTSVTVSKYDEMPNFICLMCHNQLVRTHRFQKQALKSNKTLRSYLQQLHSVDSQTKTNSYQQSTINTEMSMDYGIPQVNIKEEITENSKIVASIKQEKDTEPSLYQSETVWLNSEGPKLDEDVNTKINIKQEFEDSETVQQESFMTGSAYNPCHLDQSYDNDVNLEYVNSKQVNLDASSDLDVNYGQNDGLQYFPVDFNVGLHSNSIQEEQNALFDNSESVSSILINKPEYLAGTKQMTSEKLIKCDLCDKYFSNMRNLNKHKRLHTSEKPFLCSFSQMENLKIDKHIGETPLQCDECDMSFVQPIDLKTHRQTHSGEKHNCDFCGKYFSKISNLKRHKRIHTGEKPYRCDVCDRTFIEMAELTSHKLRHTGEKPFICDICNKGFVRSINLKIHRRIHTGEKPYICDVCDACFSDSSNLKRHKQKHLAKKLLQCDICFKFFTRIQNLNNHVAILHT